MTAVAPAEAVTPRIGQQLRRARFWVVVGAVVLALVVLQLVSTAVGGGGTFDPQDARPAGGRALAQVLRQQGVTVTRTGSIPAGAGTVLVDDADGLLSGSDWQRLLASRSRIVVVSPGSEALRVLAPGVRQAGVPNRTTVPAGCTLGLAERAGSMSLDGVKLSLRGGAGADVCFRDARGAGQLVTLRTGSTRVVLLADRTAFTNEHIGTAGNAAVALNALGATASLTWLVPDPRAFGGAGARTLQQLTPPWVTPVSALLLLGGLAAAFWKGRRFGPIVVERLPVAVRSRETVEGRARLYAAGTARLRAADALRIGAIGRMAPMLGLSRSASVEDVADAAARATGRRSADLVALLLTADPRTDRDLVHVSDDLARLEAAVRTATVPGAEPTRGNER